jgi:hypothetical protein
MLLSALVDIVDDLCYYGVRELIPVEIKDRHVDGVGAMLVGLFPTTPVPRSLFTAILPLRHSEPPFYVAA